MLPIYCHCKLQLQKQHYSISTAIVWPAATGATLIKSTHTEGTNWRNKHQNSLYRSANEWAITGQQKIESHCTVAIGTIVLRVQTMCCLLLFSLSLFFFTDCAQRIRLHLSLTTVSLVANSLPCLQLTHWLSINYRLLFSLILFPLLVGHLPK